MRRLFEDLPEEIQSCEEYLMDRAWEMLPESAVVEDLILAREVAAGAMMRLIRQDRLLDQIAPRQRIQ